MATLMAKSWACFRLVLGESGLRLGKLLQNVVDVDSQEHQRAVCSALDRERLHDNVEPV